MNKGNLKGTNSDGANGVDNEINVFVGSDSFQLRKNNRLFLSGINSSNKKYYTDSNFQNTRVRNDLYWVTRDSKQFRTDGAFTSIAYGNNIWMAGGYYPVGGGGGGFISTSTDAVTWVTRTYPGGNIYALAYGNGLFVAGGPSGSLQTSTDGATWVSRNPLLSIGGGLFRQINAIAYGNGLFVLACDVGVVRNSTDAVTWVTVTNIGNYAGSNYRAAAYGGGTWVIAGDYNGYLYSSTDGINWTLRTSGSSGRISGLGYGNGKFVSVVDTAGGNISTSTDGITWVTGNVSKDRYSNKYLYSVSYSNGLWVAVGGAYGGVEGTPWDNDFIRLSTDAITWVTGSLFLNSGSYLNSVYGNNGTWVAGGIDNFLISADSFKATPNISNKNGVSTLFLK